ncbi:PTS lactose/cellobiose transporter subunit IIA [Clostridium sp. WB02_MRS01]|uniref:PTS lactose/cellobiose transporter subunit IIA n=1 Tax=Clostridium sp. WB02_MRS01 TaxID=2605777 RepID=UPI0012B2A521|nr:PTS lactose/cellobiose transporter subunit IIA [Clostridium sp. WB02_MRS01]MSS08419.1 PTS lactose/cellobiose transporter subunit IIA [Clostridium sp. WB02_MRS01]
MENLEITAVTLISNAGMAKSAAFEALQCVKSGSKEEAFKKLEEGDAYFSEAHRIHADLIQREAAGEDIKASLLMMHTEDQLNSAEMIRSLVRELIDVLI